MDNAVCANRDGVFFMKYDAGVENVFSRVENPGARVENVDAGVENLTQGVENLSRQE